MEEIQKLSCWEDTGEGGVMTAWGSQVAEIWQGPEGQESAQKKG